MRTLLLLTSAISFLHVHSQGGVWVPKAACPGEERWGPSCFTVDGIGYMVGGYTGSDLSELWAYDPVSNTWDLKTPIPGMRRVASSFVIGNRAYVTCGLYDGSSIRNDLWEYDAAADTWTERAELPGTPRYGAAGISLNGIGYVASGCIGSGSGPYISELWAYDPTTDTWTARAGLPDQGRVGADAFVAEGRIFLLGGRQEDQSITNELWEYDPVANAWYSRTALPAGVRHYTRTWSVYNVGVISGGNEGGGSNLFDTWYYRPSTDSWLALTTYSGEGSWTGASLAIDNRIFAGLGQTLGTPHDDLWELVQLELDIQEAADLSDFAIVPNVVQPGDDLNFTGLDPFIGILANLTIVDALGKVVHVSTLRPHQSRVSIAPMSGGIYSAFIVRDGSIFARSTFTVIE